MNNIKIVDAIMGAGKTSAAIKFMNDNPDKLFLFVTPYLSEVDRIVNGVTTQEVQAIINNPDDEQEELADYTEYDLNKKNLPKNVLLRLLLKSSNRCSVAITHELFQIICSVDDASKEKDSFRYLLQDYTLIIDEVPECIDALDFKQQDKDIAQESKLISIDEDTGIVSWNPNTYGNGLFSGMKKAIKNNKVIRTKQGKKDFWLKMLDPDMFACFSDCYVLTFRFYQSLFYKYLLKNKDHFALIENEPFEMYHIENNSFVKGYRRASAEDKQRLKDLILICSKENWNDVGNSRTALSVSGWQNLSKNERIDVLNKANRFFREPQTPKQPTKETPVVIMWTVYKDYHTKEYVPKGMIGRINRKDPKDKSRISFVPCNMRASNDYGGRTHIAYLINVFMHPYIKAYLEASDIEDGYALSSMLQWLFRSAIRNGKPIEVFIPSKRMRDLLQDWLNGVIE